MGDPWIRILPQTGRTLSLKLFFEFEELFEESWASFRKEVNDGNLAIAGSCALVQPAVGDTAAGSPGSSSNAAKQIEVEEVAMSKRGAVPKSASKPKSDKPKELQDKIFDDMWKEALSNKKLLMTAAAAARELDNQIASAEAWSWAKNEQIQGQLSALSTVLRAEMTDFHRGFLAEEPATIRKRHTKEMVTVELTAFNQMKSKMLALSDFVKKLQRRHLS